MTLRTPGSHPAARLREIAAALKTLHARLLELERRRYEKQVGRIHNPFQLLRLASEDAQFAWLRPLTREITLVDELALSSDATHGSADLMIRRIRALLLGAGKTTPFLGRYRDALYDDPEVILAQGAVLRALGTETGPRLLADPRSEQDSSGMIAPGALMPGLLDQRLGPVAAVGRAGAEVSPALRNTELWEMPTHGSLRRMAGSSPSNDCRWWIAVQAGSLEPETGMLKPSQGDVQELGRIAWGGSERAVRIGEWQPTAGAGYRLEAGEGEVTLMVIFDGAVMAPGFPAMPRACLLPSGNVLELRSEDELKVLLIDIPWSDE